MEQKGHCERHGTTVAREHVGRETERAGPCLSGMVMDLVDRSPFKT